MFAAGLPAPSGPNTLIWNGLVKIKVQEARAHDHLRERTSQNRTGPPATQQSPQEEAPLVRRLLLVRKVRTTGPARSTFRAFLLPCGGTGRRSLRPPRR